MAEHDRAYRDVHFVDELSLQILPDHADSAAEPNVLPVGRRCRSLQGGVNAVSDEVERRTARHGDRRARMMREHEHVGVIRRRVAPPALPVVIGPVAANRAEHVAAEDPGADVLETTGHEIIVHAGGALTLSNHAPEGARVRHPFVEREAAAAKRVVEVLVRTRSIAVERDREGMDAKPGHTRPTPYRTTSRSATRKLIPIVNRLRSDSNPARADPRSRVRSERASVRRAANPCDVAVGRFAGPLVPRLPIRLRERGEPETSGHADHERALCRTMGPPPLLTRNSNSPSSRPRQSDASCRNKRFCHRRPCFSEYAAQVMA